jgi:hypothetical protein
VVNHKQDQWTSRKRAMHKFHHGDYYGDQHASHYGIHTGTRSQQCSKTEKNVYTSGVGSKLKVGGLNPKKYFTSEL